jgi:hypothetical protein
MLVRSILLDIGKLLDGSFALGGATSVQTPHTRSDCGLGELAVTKA